MGPLQEPAQLLPPPRFPVVGAGLAAARSWGVCHESFSQLKLVKGLQSHESPAPPGSEQPSPPPPGAGGRRGWRRNGRERGPVQGKPLLSALPSSLLHPVLSIVSSAAGNCAGSLPAQPGHGGGEGTETLPQNCGCCRQQ